MSKGRLPIADLAVRQAVSAALRQHLERSGESKRGFAQRVGISRQSLYNYLDEETTPSGEVMRLLIERGGVKVVPWGKPLTPESFPKAQSKVASQPIQTRLPFENPVSLETADRTLTIDVKRKPSGKVRLVVEMAVG